MKTLALPIQKISEMFLIKDILTDSTIGQSVYLIQRKCRF